MAEKRLCGCGQPHRHRGHCAHRVPSDQARQVDYGHSAVALSALREARERVYSSFADGRLDDYVLACARLRDLLKKV